MDTRLRIALASLAVLLFASYFATARAQEDAVFEMREASILDEEGRLNSDYFRYGVVAAQGVPCGTTPAANVVYPKLKSKSPLYGCITFAGLLPSSTIGKGFHFVVDESAPAHANKKDGDQNASKPPAPPRSGTRVSAEADVKYDTLYFDANRDSDLTNDPVKALSKKPASGFFSLGGSSQGTRIFDDVEVKPEGDPQPGTRSTRLLPWLHVQSRQQAYLVLMSTVVRKGTVRIGGQSYEAMLGNPFDRSSGTLLLKPDKGTGRRSSAPWKPVLLNMLHQDEGNFYTVSASSDGGRVTVSPYRGKFGQFRIGAPDCAIDKLGAVGTLQSKEQLTVSVGKPDYYYTAERPKQCRLPVGDYQTGYLTVDFGSVTVRLSANRYDLSGRPTTQPTYGIKIREDKPFVMDFSGQPKVVFTSPAKDRVYRPGDKVVFKALVLEPSLGSMIRGLYDTTQKTGTRPARNEQGESVSVPRYASLHPSVSITNSSGKEVANGKMPFG
jgi:hypothetical protein